MTDKTWSLVNPQNVRMNSKIKKRLVPIQTQVAVYLFLNLLLLRSWGIGLSRVRSVVELPVQLAAMQIQDELAQFSGHSASILIC